MFGYIRPMECELKVREQQAYRAHYCGLCKAIGRRHGLFARLALNYDCAFLSAFLSASGPPASFTRRRCLCHLGRGKQPMVDGSPSMAYAADVNVLLAYHAASDGWQDERRLSGLALFALLTPAARRIARDQPALYDAVKRAMDRLAALERERIPATDEPSDAFGSLMEGVVLAAPELPESAKPAAGWMFYNLGRWVYLADAWDDRQKDQTRGAYNPFLLAGTDEEQAEFLLSISLSEAEKGYDLIDLDPGQRGLTDNILYLGCRMATRRLLNKERAE